MRSIITTAILCLVCSPLVLSAQTPPEQLQQMVAALQKTPTDNILREKIIKLAVTIKPAPTVPDEALKFEGRGKFAFKNAKAEGDFLAAAIEYEKAVAAAPWIAGYYSDLCTIYEKAGKFAEAKQHCSFYLLSLTEPNEINELKIRIAGLDYGIEKSSPAAIAEREKQELVEKLKAFDGAVFVDAWEPMADGERSRSKAKIVGSEMALGYERVKSNGSIKDAERILGEQFSGAEVKITEIFQLRSLELKSTKPHGCEVGGHFVETDFMIKLDLDLATVTLSMPQCSDFRTRILRRQ